jgi:hypothetical protein
LLEANVPIQSRFLPVITFIFGLHRHRKFKHSDLLVIWYIKLFHLAAVASTLIAFFGYLQSDRLWNFSLVDDRVRLDHKAGIFLLRHDDDRIGSDFNSLHWLLEV